MDGEEPQPFTIRLVRWMIRLAVASMVLVLVGSVVQRIMRPGEQGAPAPDQEVVRLKGRVAELELELERAREELRRLRESAEAPTR